MSGFGIEMKTNMSSHIGSGVEQLGKSTKIEAAEESNSENSVSFGDTLKSMIQDTNQSQLDADGKIQELTTGRSKDLHGAVLSMEKADVDFRLLTQVRNKVLEAYREIMRMQV